MDGNGRRISTDAQSDHYYYEEDSRSRVSSEPRYKFTLIPPRLKKLFFPRDEARTSSFLKMTYRAPFVLVGGVLLSGFRLILGIGGLVIGAIAFIPSLPFLFRARKKEGTELPFKEKIDAGRHPIDWLMRWGFTGLAVRSVGMILGGVATLGVTVIGAPLATAGALVAFIPTLIVKAVKRKRGTDYPNIYYSVPLRHIEQFGAWTEGAYSGSYPGSAFSSDIAHSYSDPQFSSYPPTVPAVHYTYDDPRDRRVYAGDELYGASGYDGEAYPVDSGQYHFYGAREYEAASPEAQWQPSLPILRDPRSYPYEELTRMDEPALGALLIQDNGNYLRGFTVGQVQGMALPHDPSTLATLLSTAIREKEGPQMAAQAQAQGWIQERVAFLSLLRTPGALEQLGKQMGREVTQFTSVEEVQWLQQQMAAGTSHSHGDSVYRRQHPY